MLPPLIRYKLRQLRFALRSFVLVDGTATALIIVGITFWFDLLGDRFFEFSLITRGFLLLGIIGGIGYLVWKYLLARLFYPIHDRQLAALFEKHEPKLNESLITSVDLQKDYKKTASDDNPDDYSGFMLRKTVHRAASVLKPIHVNSLFHYKRLVCRVLFAIFFIGIIGGFCGVFADTAKIWFSRNILLSNKQWPRLSKIYIEGFDEDGHVRIARGDSFPMIIKADTSASQVPTTVSIRIKPENATAKEAKSVLVDQFTTRIDAGIEYRTFLHTISELLDSVELTISAGDTVIDGLVIEVVPPPTVINTGFTLHYPAYMKRSDQRMTPTVRNVIPEGTTVLLQMQTNKPIFEGTVSVNDSAPLPVKKIGEDVLEFSVENLRSSSTIDVFLEDFDQIKNRRPIRYELEPLKDQTPVVAGRLDGIGSAITQIAVLPVVGEITDDYGLTDVGFHYVLARNKPQSEENPQPSTDDNGTRPIVSLGGITTNQPLNHQFSVSELLAEPGDRLTLFIEASDAFSLPDANSPDSSKPHKTEGERWSLEIVSPEHLKGILEAREIGLRQRFEALIDEVMRTRVLVEEMSFEKPKVEQPEPITPPEPKTEPENAEESEQERKNEPEIEKITDDQATRGAYNTSRVIRDSEKEKYEIRGIVSGFQGIRKEMLNNQIFTPESQERIDGGILEPLNELVEKDFFEFDNTLIVLDESIGNRETLSWEAIQKNRDTTLEQLDRILDKMADIRDRMINMESFNEAIDMLKEIIEQQEKIRDETNEKKRNQLRDLLN